jgi:hypothetical protein
MRAGGPGAEARCSGVMHREVWRPKSCGPPRIRADGDKCSALCFCLRPGKPRATDRLRFPEGAGHWEGRDRQYRRQTNAKPPGVARSKPINSARANDFRARKSFWTSSLTGKVRGCRTLLRLSDFFSRTFFPEAGSVRHPAPLSSEQAYRSEDQPGRASVAGFRRNISPSLEGAQVAISPVPPHSPAVPNCIRRARP